MKSAESVSKILVMFYVFLVFSMLSWPQPAYASLSQQDHDNLTESLQILSSGWIQQHVDRSNSILIKPGYTSADWQEFFGEYFSSNPFTDKLREYLANPVFWWFDDNVHLKLQTGLVLPLETKIQDTVAAHAADLGNALETDSILRQTLFNSNRFLNDMFNVGDEITEATHTDIYNFYTSHINAYPQLWKSTVTIDTSSQPYVAAVRAQIYMNLGDALPITSARKSEIAQTIGLSGSYANLWADTTVLLIDNNGLDQTQIDEINAYLETLPAGIHDLRYITVNSLLGNEGTLYQWFANSALVNILDIGVGEWQENGFPDDISPVNADVFSLVLAHEVNHRVDRTFTQTNPRLAQRHDNLIAAAGQNHMNYLRSILPDGFFVTYPQEFYASISNQWFADTAHTLELGLVRWNNGYKHPINQFLFFAEVYSQGGNTVPFYTMDIQGHFTRTDIPVSRDVYGHICTLTVNGSTYNFSLNSEGDVLSFSKTSPVAVTWPNGGETLLMGTTQNITWTAANLTGDVDIELYKGSTKVLDIGSAATNAGTFSWNIPINLTAGTDYKIRIHQGGLEDYSNSPFSIVMTGPMINLALRKPATQSSTYAMQTGAEKAVDGNTSGRWGADSLSCTNKQGGAWWQVDLQGNYRIYQVKVYNRTDCCGERLSNFKVRISLDKNTWTDFLYPGTAGNMTVIATGGVVGRYVQIKLVGENFLTLAEVEVMGENNNLEITVTAPNGGESWFLKTTQAVTWNAANLSGDVAIGLYKGDTKVLDIGSASASIGAFSWNIPFNLAVGCDYRIRVHQDGIEDYSNQFFSLVISGPLSNLALRKPATQSSTYASQTGAEKAVDGNTNGRWGADSLSCTNKQGGAWWQVDLQGNYRIYQVNVYNRTDCCGERLSNFKVRVSLDKNTWTDFLYPGTAGNMTVIATGGVIGRYVRIQLVGENFLTLAEVEVMGESTSTGITVTSPNGGETWQAGIVRHLTFYEKCAVEY